MSEEG